MDDTAFDSWTGRDAAARALLLAGFLAAVALGLLFSAAVVAVAVVAVAVIGAVLVAALVLLHRRAGREFDAGVGAATFVELSDRRRAA